MMALAYGQDEGDTGTPPPEVPDSVILPSSDETVGPPAPTEAPPTTVQPLRLVVVAQPETPKDFDAHCAHQWNRRELQVSPARRAPDVMKEIPHLRTTSRLGAGGAYDYTYRGFDAGHGRDLSVYVDGIPLSEASHLIGPGYVDLYFIPKLALSSMTFCSSASRPDVGAFGTAGSVHLDMGMPEEGFTVGISGSSDGGGLVYGSWRPKKWDEDTFVIAEIEGGEGVGANRNWRHLRLMGAISGTSGPVEAKGRAIFYDGVFGIPGLLDEADLADNTVSYYGDYRPHVGLGHATRAMLTGTIRRPWAWGALHFDSWVQYQSLQITNNLTGFAYDVVNGDGIKRDQRSVDIGLKGDIKRTFSFLSDESSVEAGLYLQATSLLQRVYSVDQRGQVIRDQQNRRVDQSTVGLWGGGTLGLGRWGFAQASVRVEQIAIRQRPEGAGLVETDPTPVRNDAAYVAAPKVSALIRPTPNYHVEASFGRGYRPPDARLSADVGRVFPVYIDTLELRNGFDLGRRFEFEFTGYSSWGQRERILDRFTNRLLASDDTLRVGTEGEGAIWINPVLAFTGAASWNYSILRSSRDRLPYAPVWTAQVGLKLDEFSIKTFTLNGSLQARATGQSKIPGDLWSPPFITTDASIRLDWLRWFFQVSIVNVIPIRWPNARTVIASRWTQDTLDPPMERLHTVSGDPFVFSIGAGGKF